MITAKLSLLLSAAASVVQGSDLTGFLIDKTCVYKFDCEPGKCAAPDGSNVFHGPEEHTGWCLLLNACITSGYVLLSDDPMESGRHTIIANFTDDASNLVASTFIKKTQPGCGRPPCLTRSKTTPFPRIAIADADSYDFVDGVVQVTGSVVVKDPWSEDAYDGSPTTQTICHAMSDASIEENNMCFRSDVVVTSADVKKMTVIESNGCPDHASMQGGPGGPVANSQEWPTLPEPEPGADLDPSLCPAELENSFEFDDAATFHYKISDGVLQGCLEVEHDGFIAFGIAAQGANVGGYMNGGDAIIGLPASDTVEMYDLVGYTTPVRMDDAQQTLTGTSIIQEDGMTVMQFTKILVEDGKNPILDTGANVFLHSRGGDSLGYHGPNRFFLTKDFSEDQTRYLQSTGTNGPSYQHYTMMIPRDPGTPGNPTDITGDVVGIMTNGVLLTKQDPTWAYDGCNGQQSARQNKYNYHIPSICYLQSMGVPSPPSDAWWVNDAGTEVRPFDEMHLQFPSTGSSPVVGFALDGFPIYALYGPEEGSDLVRSAFYNGDLDECNGKGEGMDYAYYITAEPPFVPTCLRGSAGNFASFTTDQKCPAAGIENTISGLKEVPDEPTPAEPPSTDTPPTPDVSPTPADTPTAPTETPGTDTSPTPDASPSSACAKSYFLGTLASMAVATVAHFI